MAVLDDILNSYPALFDKREHSNHYKYHKALSSLEEEYLRDKLLVELGQQIRRPIQIWREQIQPYIYEIKYEVSLDDIKQVKLYRDGEEQILLQDSGVLEGVKTYSSSYNAMSEEIIPVDKYFLEVETHEGRIFRKGIPENNTSVGDVYDHDQALDVWGLTLQIPRQRFKEDILPEDYPYTKPSYFTDATECDVAYEERIIESMENYRKYPLTIAEIKRVLGVLVIVTGRWRIVDAGGHVEDGEYNAAVHEFSASLDNIPKNIDFGSAGDIQSIINRTMPVGKKGYFVLSQEESLGNDPFTLLDNIGEWTWIPEGEAFNLTDYLMASVETTIEETLSLVDAVKLTGLMQPTELLELQDQVAFTNIGNIRQENLSFFDQVKLLGLMQQTEALSLSEDIHWTEIARILYHDTNTDFALDTLVGCSISGTGSAAYVKLDPLNTNQSRNPTGQSQSSEGFAWNNPGNVVDTDSSTYGYTEKPAPVYGDTGAKASTTQASVNESPDNPTGGGIWQYRERVEVNDDTGAYASATTSYRNTDALRVTGFGFNIPSDATVSGVIVRVKRKSSTSVTPTRDYRTQLIYNGNRIGDNKASTDNLSQSYITKSYGSSSDKWGYSLTPAMVNSSSFGVDLSYYNGTSYNPTFYVDYVNIIVYYTIPTQYSYPKLLNLSGLSFSIPSGSEVVGVMARIKSWCKTTDKTLTVTLTAGGVSKNKTLTLPTSASNLDFGSGSDRWGGLPNTPNSYNTVTMSLDVNTGYRVQIYHITIYVYYKLQDGTLQTATITAPGDGYSWNKLETVQSVPSQCGANALLYDILRDSDNAILLSNQVPPVDLSTLAYQNLKVKAKFHTDNVAYYPRIDSLKVTALKNRSY